MPKRRSLESAGTVGDYIDAIYSNNPKEEFLGEPKHHYDFTQSEEWANAHGYYPDKRGHRDDRVKKPTHPSHPSRGTWEGNKFILTDKGLADPNYIFFGLNDGGQDPQAILKYKDTYVIPEITITPKGNYINNSYDNIRLHFKEGGIYIAPSKHGTFTAAATKHGMPDRGKSSFVRNLEIQPTILEQVAEYNKEPKVRKPIKETIKQQRIREQKAANKRERNIAKHYLADGPNIGNLAKAAYHWYNSVPYLGGQPEDGNTYITGEAPTPGMRNPRTIVQGIKTITKANAFKATAKDWDTAYNTAVKSGDVAEAKRLRDLHFMAKAPNTKIKQDVYHGTDSRVDFGNKIRLDKSKHGKAFYTSTNKTDVEPYAGYTKNGESLEDNIIKFKVNSENPYIPYDYSPDVSTGYRNRLIKYGYDGVLQKGSAYKGNVFVGIHPNKLKLSDAITYDNTSNIIPLSKRDNFNINDIRYALFPTIGGVVGYGAARKYLDEQRPQEHNGGSIYIAPSKRGTFTAAATKHGIGVQEFAAKVLRNKEDYSPSLVKKANFARNASKWNH